MGSRIPKSLNVVVPTLVIAGLLGALLAVSGAAAVHAQATEPARLSLDSINLNAADTFTATVALHPGTSRISAISATVHYDATVLEVLECRVNGTGACHAVDGEVRFAILSVSGFEHSEEFLSIDFERMTGEIATELKLKVETAADVVGVPVEEIDLVAGNIEWIEADGSITGAVIDAVTGEGIYNVNVCASVDGEEPVCVATTGLGNYVVQGLSSGLYNVTISDPSGVYESVSLVGTVTSPERTSGMGAELGPLAAIDVVPETPSNSQQDAVEQPNSISGHVFDADSGGPIFGLNVCATMPLVHIQGCTYTTVTGSFDIGDLPTGNYELTVTDPARRFGDSPGGVYVGVTSQLGAEAELTVSRR